VPPFYVNPSARSWDHAGPDSTARAFHRTLPGYAPTPLVELPTLAAELGVGRVLVKDESSRLGLPAFKVLGASWACKQVLAAEPHAVLVTATDGNHGRAVARMAAHFGTTAVVFLPEVMVAHSADLIAAEGAWVIRVDGDYDEAVRAAAAYAGADPARVLVQDTAWDGYEEVPGWIVDGYATLLEEVDEALTAPPDLVAVPVGVGSLAQAVVMHYRRPGGGHPIVLAVEPDTAACVITSLINGSPATVDTDSTVMAGLNCGTISRAAWPILRSGCDAAVTVTDRQALTASADLAGLGVSSGPCGAATLAGARRALREPVLRRTLGLGSDAVLVLLSTEGAQS
jgi:diaminopropionate ammonia-lyase